MRFVDCFPGITLCLQCTECCKRCRSNSKSTTANDLLLHEAKCPRYAPDDKKRASARVNWLVRQLRDVDGDDVIVRAFWRGRGGSTSTQDASLTEIKSDPRCLESGHTGATPTSFEVVMIRDIAGRFSGRRTFIEDLENLIPEFYDRIGQNLRPWAPPPPSIDKRDPIQDTDIVEANKERNVDGVLQSESDQPRDSQEPNDAGFPPAED